MGRSCTAYCGYGPSNQSCRASNRRRSSHGSRWHWTGRTYLAGYG